MWKPSSADELIQAINANTLPHESAAFEVKEKLPDRQANRELAADVAAMATDGGVIIYGVRENKATNTFTSKPIELAGVKDRISEILTSNLRERVEFDVSLLAMDGDPSKGFVVVDVPASPRAPHMVEVKGEYRYYGRVPGGNKELTEAEVARLYDRREESERQARRSLDDAIAEAPIPPEATRGDLHIVIHPLVPDPGVRARAWTSEDPAVLASEISLASNSLRFEEPWTPRLSDIISGGQQRPTLDGLALTNGPIDRDTEQITRWVSRLEVLDDGTCRYFRAAVAEQTRTNGLSLIRCPAIAQITAHLAAMVGHFLDTGEYHGAVDVSLAITGAAGATSTEWYAQGRFSFGAHPGVPTNDYRDRVRVSANQLVSDPCDVSRRLLARLFRIVRSPNFPDPLRH